MKDVSREYINRGRPDEDTLWLLDFCLDALYKDTKHKFNEDINKNLTYEELLGTLLKAKDEIQFLRKE
jgi:hypothetical protein